jgi:outer membrane usher protein
MARSAVFLQYKPATIGGATLILVTADGAPVPQGAIVKVNGKAEEYEVALRGEVFVTEISYPALVHAEWEGHTCEVRIEREPADNVVPRIGPLTCNAANRK